MSASGVRCAQPRSLLIKQQVQSFRRLQLYLCDAYGIKRTVDLSFSFRRNQERPHQKHT